MENQPTNRTSRRKNAQPPRGMAGETSKKASTSRSTAQKPSVVPTPETVPVPVPTTLTTPPVVRLPPEVVESEPTTTVAPRTIKPAMVNPTTSAVIPASTTVTPSDDAKTERIVREMLKTMKASKKPSKLFARMSEALKKEEAASQLTLLEIPPRPQTLVETPTSQALAALKENPQIAPETLTQEIPLTAQITHTETQPSTETLVGRGEETQAREGQVGDDAPSTGAGEGERKSMSEGEEGRKGKEAETAEDRESEGEEVEKNEEREVAEGSGAEEAEGSMSEGEEVEGVKGDEAEGSKKVDEDSEVEGEEGEDSERELENVEERDEEVSEGEEEPERITGYRPYECRGESGDGGRGCRRSAVG